MTYGLGTILGDGIDSFTTAVAPYVRIPAGLEGDIGAVAITAAGLAALTTALSVAHVIRGPGDALMLAGHIRQRIGAFAGRHKAPPVWGIVHAAGRPAALASVRLVAHDGTPVAHSITDAHGRYGFAAAHTGTRLEVAKDGHWPSAHPVILKAGTNRGTDLAIHAHEGGGNRPHAIPQVFVRLASAGFFWTAVLTAPMAAMYTPDALTLSALVITSAVAAVRGTGIHLLP